MTQEWHSWPCLVWVLGLCNKLPTVGNAVWIHITKENEATETTRNPMQNFLISYYEHFARYLLTSSRTTLLLHCNLTDTVTSCAYFTCPPRVVKPYQATHNASQKWRKAKGRIICWAVKVERELVGDISGKLTPLLTFTVPSLGEYSYQEMRAMSYDGDSHLIPAWDSVRQLANEFWLHFVANLYPVSVFEYINLSLHSYL